MNKIFCFALLSVSFIGGLTACGTATNTNTTTNTNRMGSNANSATNANANSNSSITNTISNAATSLTTPSADEFMRSAAQSGMAEVELGRLAATKAQNAEVKKFAQMMVNDHGKANTELKALAAKKNITLPADMGSHKSSADELKGLAGAEFDNGYVDAMVDAHETDVNAFQKQADNAADPEVKAFAAKTLPTLKMHLEAIKGIQSKMP